MLFSYACFNFILELLRIIEIVFAEDGVVPAAGDAIRDGEDVPRNALDAGVVCHDKNFVAWT